MPYQKSYSSKYRKSYTKPEKSWHSKYHKALSPALGLVALAAAEMVKRKYLNSEKKHLDYSYTQSPTTAGLLAVDNVCIQGTDNDQRVGRSVRFTSLQYNVTLNLHASATRSRCRIMIVRDKYPQGVVANIADIVATGGTQGLKNWDNSKRFQIMVDRHMVVNTDYPEKSFTIFKKLGYQAGKTKFDDSNAGTIADIENNAFYFISFSDEGTNVPLLSVQTRYIYIDN